MREHKLYQPCYVDYDTEVSRTFYKSRYAAETAAKKAISKAYEQADDFFIPDSRTCIARSLAHEYGAEIPGAERKLLRLFEEELLENDSYYRMYQKSYFLDAIRITTYETETELFESSFLNGLVKLLHDDSEYGIENFYEVIMELQEDVNKRADTFCSAAHEIFLRFTAQDTAQDTDSKSLLASLESLLADVAVTAVPPVSPD